MFAVTLNAGAKTAAVAPFFADNATATGVNAPNAGKKVTLALTDPDSNRVVPSSSPEFAGDFMLSPQGDSVPSTCPAPDDPANSLGTINLKTGTIGKVALIGPVTPEGLIFVP